jgi:hypothetical protein
MSLASVTPSIDNPSDFPVSGSAIVRGYFFQQSHYSFEAQKAHYIAQIIIGVTTLPILAHCYYI